MRRKSATNSEPTKDGAVLADISDIKEEAAVPAVPKATWRSALNAMLGLSLAAAIIGWGLPWLGHTSWTEIGRRLDVVGFVTCLELFGWVVLGLWLYTFALTGSIPGLSHVRALIVNVAGSAAGNLLPGGGAAGVGVSYLMLRSWGFSTAAISASVIVTGVWNVVARMAMPLLGVALLSSTDALPKGVRRGAFTGGIVGLIVIAVFVFVLVSPKMTDRFGAFVQRQIGSRVSARRGQKSKSAIDLHAVLIDQRKRLATVTAHGWFPMTVGVVGFLGVYYVLFARTMDAVGVHLTPGKMFAAYAVGRLLTAVGVTPGGLGVTEAGTLAVLVAWGADRPSAAAGVLVFAVFTHLLEVPLGALGWLAWWLMPKVGMKEALGVSPPGSDARATVENGAADEDVDRRLVRTGRSDPMTARPTDLTSLRLNRTTSHSHAAPVVKRDAPPSSADDGADSTQGDPTTPDA